MMHSTTASQLFCMKFVQNTVSITLFQTYTEQRINCATTATTKLKGSIVACSDQVNRSVIICLHLIWIKFALMGDPAGSVMKKSTIAGGAAVSWGTGAHRERAALTAFQSKTATTKPYGSLSSLIPHIKETTVCKKSIYDLTFLICILFLKNLFHHWVKFFLLLISIIDLLSHWRH